MLKRLTDLSIATILLILLSPLMVYIAWKVRKTTPGPALFVQLRVGRDQRLFRVFKFRTLYHHSGTEDFIREGDDRITPFGCFLRKRHLDELAQLLNVFLGTMSLVGPRPLVPHEVKEMLDEDPELAARFLVRPGITGPWQLVERHQKLHALHESYQLDLGYLKYWSHYFDFTLMLQTVRAVLTRRGV